MTKITRAYFIKLHILTSRSHLTFTYYSRLWLAMSISSLNCVKGIKAAWSLTLFQAYVELTGMLLQKIVSSQCSGARCNFPLQSFTQPLASTWALWQWPFKSKTIFCFTKNVVLMTAILLVTTEINSSRGFAWPWTTATEYFQVERLPSVLVLRDVCCCLQH